MYINAQINSEQCMCVYVYVLGLHDTPVLR